MAHPEAEAVVVTDWKTGKFRPESQEEYLEQLDLYGLGALLIYAGRPGLVVRPRLVYTDLGRIYPNCVDEPVVEYRPEDLPKLKKTWEKRVKPMLADKTFAPKPNKYCYSCHYRASNKANGGGQCKF
jgi:CRISPR/Cas system-associated exonuclease Cas4 (RecB family)